MEFSVATTQQAMEFRIVQVRAANKISIGCLVELETISKIRGAKPVLESMAEWAGASPEGPADVLKLLRDLSKRCDRNDDYFEMRRASAQSHCG